MSAMRSIARPRKRPLPSSASFAVVTLSRPCASPRKCSLRSATHFTGRLRRRAAKPARRVFTVGKEFGAETPADIGGHDPHLVFGDLEHVRAQHVPDCMAALA